MKNFIEEFKKRGYFYQCTNLAGLTRQTEENRIVAYIGFDCTARSLHVGNLMQIMILRLLQRHGHKPLVIIGGATTKIGDPTGKDEMRNFLSEEKITQNIAGIKHSLEKFIKFGSGQNDAVMLNNADWLEKIGYIDFLRDYGRMFSINRMLTMDSVHLRLAREQPLTFLEFNYMLLQAYDFTYLNKQYNCCLQIGGSDQWGNIVIGADLVRKINNREVFGLTTPLLTTSSGSKMGKSVNGAVWLNHEQLSSYGYFQYWRNIEDADVIKFAWLYSEYDEVQMHDFSNLAKENINEAKKQLAHRLTAICHGIEQADSALHSATGLFERGIIDGENNNLPIVNIAGDALRAGIACYNLLVKTGLTDSNGAGRRLIRGGGVQINNEKIKDENLIIDLKYLQDGFIKIATGKKNFILIKPEL